MFKKSLFKNDELDELGKAIYSYIDKNAKSRDCVDKIALVLDDYSKAEKVTTAFKQQISDFANILLDVGTKRDAHVRAMETNVLEQLSDYEKVCSHVQNLLKVSVVAGEKERNWERQLNRMKATYPQDQEQVSLAEAELIKARGESVRSLTNLEEQVDIFEKKRLNSIKEALLAWTLAELHFHAKALQLFTDAYRIAADINIQEDIEEFRNKLRAIDDTPRRDGFHRSDSMLQLLSIPFRRKTKFIGSGIPHPCSVQSSPRCSQLNSSQED